MKWVIALSMFLVLTVPVHAAWLQYDTASLQIVGAFELAEDARPLAGSALIEIPGVTKANIAWPIPGGCTSGRQEWTLLSFGGVLPLRVNPALIFFRCQIVTSAASLQVVINTETDRLTATVEKADGRVRMIAILGFAEGQCNCTSITGGQCDANTGASCTEMRANNNTIGARLGNFAEIVAYQNAIIQLYTDAAALKSAQGW
jgi:hypothetical protein